MDRKVERKPSLFNNQLSLNSFRLTILNRVQLEYSFFRLVLILADHLYN